MNWKGCFFSEPARLSLRHAQLHIDNAEGNFDVPLEDLAFIVLDSRQATLTSALLAACADHGCVVISTDARHMPNGVLHSFHGHHRQPETAAMQIALTEPRKKRLWQILIQHKIRNQAACLRALSLPEAATEVAVLAQKVRSGDPDNVEGQAARSYWGGMRPCFRRDCDGGDRLNALLNYGYALLRSVLAQTLTAYGFLPCFGIHHRSMQNPFNLADDLIEPWRPLADLPIIRYRNKTHELELFSSDDRRHVAGLLQEQVRWMDGEQSVLSALRRYVEQLRPYYAGRQNEFHCPDFVESALEQKS